MDYIPFTPAGASSLSRRNVGTGNAPQAYVCTRDEISMLFAQKHRPEGKIEHDIYIIIKGIIGIFPAIGVWFIKLQKFH